MSRRIRAQVKPNSKRFEGITRTANGYLIQVKAPAIDGEANQRAIEVLADYFQTSRSRIKLISGQTSRYKIFEIE